MKLFTGVGEAEVAVSAGVQAANAGAVMGDIETAWCLLAESGICVEGSHERLEMGRRVVKRCDSLTAKSDMASWHRPQVWTISLGRAAACNVCQFRCQLSCNAHLRVDTRYTSSCITEAELCSRTAWTKVKL